MKKQICVLCNEEFVGYGNNTEPLLDGVCCDKCNVEIVIPARFDKINESDE